MFDFERPSLTASSWRSLDPSYRWKRSTGCCSSEFSLHMSVLCSKAYAAVDSSHFGKSSDPGKEERIRRAPGHSITQPSELTIDTSCTASWKRRTRPQRLAIPQLHQDHHHYHRASFTHTVLPPSRGPIIYATTESSRSLSCAGFRRRWVFILFYFFELMVALTTISLTILSRSLLLLCYFWTLVSGLSASRQISTWPPISSY
jgi:hypothetical protein